MVFWMGGSYGLGYGAMMVRGSEGHVWIMMQMLDLKDGSE